MSRSPEPQLAARPDPPAGDAPSSASEASDDDEDAYEVEAIRASRFDEYAGAMRYFIKWKGYGENEKTWEPTENLQNCLGLVREFERHQAEIKRKLAERQAEASADRRDKSLTKKAAARPSSSNNAPEGDGVSLKELDARREKAKKARASDTRLQAGRVESSVADKWEKKGKKKARSSEPVASTSNARDATRPPAKKRREADDKPASSPAKKRKTPKVAVESDESSEDDSAPAKRPRPAATSVPAKTAAAAPNGTTSFAAAATKPVNGARPSAGSASSAATGPEAQPVASTSTPTTEPRASAEPAPTKPQPRRPSPGKQGPWETISSLMGKSFKKAPPPPAPAPVAATASTAEHARSPRLDSPVDGPAHNSRVRFASEPEGPAAPRPAAAAQPVHSALRPGPAQPAARRASPAAAAAQPAALAAGPGVATPMPDGPVGGDSPLEEGEERAAADVPDTVRQMEMQRLKRLADMEARLRRTTWCRNDARFELEALPVACAEAIPIDATLVRRLKGKGVAVLFSSGEDARGGEGIALGYLLMAMRAITPDRLEAVEAVFLHRHDSFAQIEGLYAELVNLEHHAVEFFRFGGGEPVESIFGSGYLVVPTLSALQRGASYDRFCTTVRDVYARTCQMYAHPATVAYLRTLPNWFSIVDRLNATDVDIIAREELPLSSAFASVDKSTLLQPAATWPPSIPQVDSSIELNEIITHIVHTRFKYATTWRRFVVVVDELRNEDVNLARKRGIELATWESLSDLVKAHPFG